MGHFLKIESQKTIKHGYNQNNKLNKVITIVFFFQMTLYFSLSYIF